MTIGQFGEQLAAKYLVSKGYKIIEKNFKCKIGEIDIVAEKNETLVIVEVKTRKTDLYGSPVEAVGYKKLNKLKKLSEYYTINHTKYNKVKIEVVGINISNNSISLFECIE